MRKVLSFVLVLSLVLGSFSMAFAANSSAGLTDIAGNANADAIQVAYDLGIVTGNPDGTFQPDKAVNRAEFAAMITRALAIPDSALAGYTSTTFKDTVGYGWAVPYLAFCQSKGIMLGDGAGNVMPGRTITVNEAVTMALRAIGYTQNSALLVGAWPANYVSIAQNEDLYDKVSSDTTVNKANAAQIIYNLLTVQKVAVNSDGETIFQVDKNGDALNLLNSNLGCTEDKDVILGKAYDYDSTLINITDKIGAYGTAYVNDDSELVAFTVKSTALTGKIEDGKFKVGSTKYNLPTGTTTVSALFANTDDKGTSVGAVDTIITDFAAINSDNGDTVTINVDLSGKNIKEVYSIVAWEASDDFQADSDIQEEIAEDKTINNNEFVLDDDDEIDLTQFQLVGVASLSDIEEDNVVYVYCNSAGDIRKVAVGTETVEGTVEETDSNTVTVNGKDYDIAELNNVQVLSTSTDVDLDSEGIFYLDYSGKVYAFEGTSANADNYAVVKVPYDAGSGYTDPRIKLYLADDSTKTFNFEDDDISEIDLTTVGALGSNDVPASLVTGAMIGYSLNSDGDIDALDTTSSYGSIKVKSTKVLNFESTDYAIDANAVVFTFDGATPVLSTVFEVAALGDMELNDTTDGAIMLNDDDKVVAILLPAGAVDDKDTDAVYGVINKTTKTKNADDEAVLKFVGFIDGDAFTKLTENDSVLDKAGVFGLYKITVDSDDVITKVEALGLVDTTNGVSGQIVAEGETNNTAYVITGLNSDKTVITTASGKFTVDDDAVVYKHDPNGGSTKFSVSKLSSLRVGYTVALYDTKGDDADGTATVVVYQED